MAENLSLYKKELEEKGFVEPKSRNSNFALFASLRLNRATSAV